jgi:hypothetical protein
MDERIDPASGSSRGCMEDPTVTLMRLTTRTSLTTDSTVTEIAHFHWCSFLLRNILHFPVLDIGVKHLSASYAAMLLVTETALRIKGISGLILAMVIGIILGDIFWKDIP